MKYIIILLAVTAAGTGFWAAYKWCKASKVEIDLGYHPPGLPGGTVRRMGMDVPRFPQPVVSDDNQTNEIIATWEAISAASQLNRVAAKWTAISVGLSAVATIAGVIACD